MSTVNTIIFSDEITLYWDKTEENSSAEATEILVNHARHGTAVSTHYSLKNLTPETTYCIELRGRINETLTLTTSKEKHLIDVTKAPFCAPGDGSTLNTKVLQEALDHCTADDMIYFPAGTYMTGALRLHSDMELYLEEGAILQGTQEIEDYLPRIWSRFEGTELSCYSSVLNMGELDSKSGYNCKNVIIRGGGTIASGGRILARHIIESERERLKEYLEELGDKVLECENLDTIPGRVRPRLINMSNCQNIVLSEITFRDGASWNIHMIYSDQITTYGCKFYSKDVWNGDGWDPDSSTNCTIFDCQFFTGDDSVAVKSGKNPEGNVINRPTEHIRIFDCKCAFGHGITIGSEMSGGVIDVKIWDCDLGVSKFGIEIKGTKKRGGYVRDVHVSNTRTSRIQFHSVGYNDDGISADTAPVFENCDFTDMEILGEFPEPDGTFRLFDAIELCGFDEPGHELKNISFNNIQIGVPGKSRKQTLSLQLCEGISFSNIKCL